MNAGIRKFIERSFGRWNLQQIHESEVECRRLPTEAEIAFGCGAEHCRNFPLESLINRDGRLKRKFLAKDEGLWYTV